MQELVASWPIIYLVRHGETKATLERRYEGAGDSDLTERGLSQARSAARKLAGTGARVVYSSPRLRALRTSEVIAGQFGLIPVVLDDLAEASFGTWEGLTYEEIRLRDPDRLDRWLGNPLHVSPPGGESLTEMWDRVRRCIRKVMSTGETVVVASHGGPIRAVLSCCEHGDLRGFWETSIKPGEVRRVCLAGITLRTPKLEHHHDEGYVNNEGSPSMAVLANTSLSAEEPSQRELRRGIFAMIWPVTVENVLQLLIGFVNTAMVGRLGAATILAVGLSGRVGMFVWIIFGAIGTGTTVLIARALGAGDKERVRRVAWQGLLLALVLMGVIAGAAFVFAPSLLQMFKATSDALPIGTTYLRILAFSMPFQALYLVISAILRGSGNTRVPMQIAFVINLVNVAVNQVLIFGRFGFPAMGYRGSAIATIVGQATGATIAAYYLFSPRSGVGIKLRDRVSVDIPLIRRLLGIGIPSSAEMFFWQLASIVVFRLINSFGTVAGAAYQMGLQAEGISYMPTIGFGIAATTFAGRSLGARNPHLAERYVKQIVRWGVALTSCTTLILVFGPRALMSILTNDQAVIALGAQYLLLMGLSQIPQQISGTLGAALRGAGDTVTPAIAATVGIWGFRIPFAFLLAQRFHLGVHGAWWAINMDQYVRLIIVGWQYLRGKWKSAIGDGMTSSKPW